MIAVFVASMAAAFVLGATLAWWVEGIERRARYEIERRARYEERR
jgi:cytochrome bd-type quinol oxidase subunit 2